MSATSLSSELLTVTCKDGDPTAARRWQAVSSFAYPAIRVSPKGGLHGRFRTAASADFQMTDIEASAQFVERVPDPTGNASDFYKVSLQLSGSGIMRQDDRTLLLTPGTMTLYDTGRPYTLDFNEDYRFLVAMFPKAALEMPHGVLGELVARPLDTGRGIGAVAAAYLRSVSDQMEALPRRTGQVLARTGLSLVAALLSEHFDSEHTPTPGGGVVLAQVCYYINQNLADPDLSPAVVAAANFISTRYLYYLFRNSGTGVAEWIKHRRLARAREDLADPALREVSIAGIGRRWGLPDAPYFSRAFREAYGETPGAYRARCLAPHAV